MVNNFDNTNNGKIMNTILYFYNDFRLPEPVEFTKAYIHLKGEKINQFIDGFTEDEKEIICYYFDLQNEITEENIYKFLNTFKQYVKSGKVEYTQEQKDFINNLASQSISELHKEMLPCTIEVYLKNFKYLIYQNIKTNFFNFNRKKWYEYNKKEYNLKEFLKFFGLEKEKEFARLEKLIDKFNEIVAYILLVIIFAITTAIGIIIE